MKVGIDTNILVHLFQQSESVNDLVEIGCLLYTSNRCLWEMVKCLEKINPEEDYAERVVAEFLKKNKINVITKDIEKSDTIKFEEKCSKKGIDCHKPDSEILLAFKDEGVDIIWSDDINLKKAARLLGISTV